MQNKMHNVGSLMIDIDVDEIALVLGKSQNIKNLWARAWPNSDHQLVSSNDVTVVLQKKYSSCKISPYIHFHYRASLAKFIGK